MISLRPLEFTDISNLSQIRATYHSPTILVLEKSGSGITTGWQLVERPIPFDKRTLYDFDAQTLAIIRQRLEQPTRTYQRVAEDEGQLVGLLDMELQEWNNTVVLWNLRVDLAYRRQGLGRRLWHRGLEYAQNAGVRAIMLETQNTNVDACRFYAEMGCQLVGLNEALYSNDWQKTEAALFWAYFIHSNRPQR